MIHLPSVRQGPLRALGIRLVAAFTLVLGTVAVIYADRTGYRDVNEDGLSLLDCFYYAVVSLSTSRASAVIGVMSPYPVVESETTA